MILLTAARPLHPAPTRQQRPPSPLITTCGCDRRTRCTICRQNGSEPRPLCQWHGRVNEKGERVYTLKKSHGEEEQPTLSAHPARFSPDDKFSAQRLACKKRFGLLPTQKERDAL